VKFQFLSPLRESPRIKGRHEEVRSFIAQHHASSDENAPLVVTEVKEIEATPYVEAEVKQKTKLSRHTQNSRK